MTDTETTKQKLKRRPTPAASDILKGGLSFGLDLLDLACSGNPNVGMLKGHYYLWVGDSQAGKSWLGRQILAEACRNSAYKDYRLIHDEPERGCLMDIPRYFGSKLNSRLEPPTKNGPSRTLEDFYQNHRAAVKAGPCIYVLDSEDALQSEADAAEENGKKKGSMGMEKAKRNSTGLRSAHNLLDTNGSILIVIKQTRQNVGFDAQFNPKTRSGGKALTFYATEELWFSIKEKIRKNVLGKPRVVGSRLKIHVKKNRVQGRDRSVEIPFYPSSGMDNTGANVMFLLEEGHWKGTEKKVVAPEFDWDGSIEGLIKKVEGEGAEQELKMLVSEVWERIEEGCAVKRKLRYD